MGFSTEVIPPTASQKNRCKTALVCLCHEVSESTESPYPNPSPILPPLSLKVDNAFVTPLSLHRCGSPWAAVISYYRHTTYSIKENKIKFIFQISACIRKNIATVAFDINSRVCKQNSIIE